MGAQGSQVICPLSHSNWVARFPIQAHLLAAAYSGPSWASCSFQIWVLRGPSSLYPAHILTFA